MNDHTPETPQKQCTKCGRSFPATAEYFSRDKYNADGFTYQCKECRRANAKRHYTENRDKELERVRKYREENRERVNEYSRQYREADPERWRRIYQASHERHKEEIRERRRRSEERRVGK